VSFKGVISYNGTVRIDGNLDGEIHTEGVLLVGEDAVLTAKITAGTVVCKGKITGDISAREKVKLRAPAVVNAGVKAPLLAMEEGRGLQRHVGDEPDRYARASGALHAGPGRQAGQRISWLSTPNSCRTDAVAL
jgi:cytoskeletal protein CcmA (bactofilin family)